MNIEYTLDRDAQERLHRALESTVAEFCDGSHISGELAWLATKCYSDARIQMFKTNRL